MSLKSSSSFKLCLVSGLFVAAVVIVSSPSVSPSLAEACGCGHGHHSSHSGREEEPEATCHHHHHDHDHNNERRDTVTSSYSPLESVGLNVHNTLVGENKKRVADGGRNKYKKEEDCVVSSETEKVDDGAEDGVLEEQHQGGCPFDHHEGHAHDHHHHHEGGHDEDDHHHHHHEHHHHEHDHDHHDHEHHPSSPSLSVNDYDWVATVRDKESGAVKHTVPILLMHKESGIARFTPLTFEHYMMKGGTIEKQQQAQQDASFIDSSLKRDGADGGDGAEKRKERGKASSSSSSSTALASLIFYYTTPCGGLCEDSYKLYVAAASALNKAMAESLATFVGNLKGKEENSFSFSSVASSSSPSPSDKTSSQSSSLSATATTAASFIARAKKFIESKLLTAQFYIPKASKAQEDAYYRHHSQHEEEAAPPDAASSSSSSSPLPKGAFVPASPSYYSVVARHGVRGSVITNDFPLITIEINSSPKSKSVAHVAEGNEGIIGFTGSLTPWSLWFDGVRPVLYAEHKPYCDGLSEIKALLVRAASKGTTAPPTTTPTVTNEGEESQQTPTAFSNSNKGTKGSFTPQDVSTVLSSVPDHDLWMAFCDLLAEGPEETVSNRDVTATTDSSFLTNLATYTSATASTDASSDITNPSAGGATSSEETMMSRSVGQIFKSRLTASTRNCGPQCEEEEKQRKGDADVEKDSPATHQDVANGVDHSHFEGMDDMVANVHATVDEAEAVRVINITDYVFENGLLA